MALGKLWNALFGKRAAAEDALAVASDAQTPPAEDAGRYARILPATADSVAAGKSALDAEARGSQSPTVTKVKRKSLGKRDRNSTPVAQTAPAPSAETVRRPAIRIAQPQKNAWTKLVQGRRIGSILDMNLGDATRAVEVLQAIVCDAVPTPKYIAIDLFELGSGPLTIVEFHQRVRRVGGQPVAIPADLFSGLRQLSQTLGAVDLVLMDGSDIDLTNLELRRLLGRVTHSDSLVLHRDARGNWQSVETTGAVGQPAERQSKAA